MSTGKSMRWASVAILSLISMESTAYAGMVFDDVICGMDKTTGNQYVNQCPQASSLTATQQTELSAYNSTYSTGISITSTSSTFVLSLNSASLSSDFNTGCVAFGGVVNNSVSPPTCQMPS